MQNDEDTQQDDTQSQGPVPGTNDEAVQPVDDGAQGTVPSANDVLAQQMGTEYTNVENLDKQELQTDLAEQTDTEETTESVIPSEGAVDDRNTSDGQLIGS